MSEVIFKPEGPPAEVLLRVLGASAVLLASERATTLSLPDDELHREILLPLLPAMLGDEALREFWVGQGTRGFLARLDAHLAGGGPAPRWEPGDFEIHVTASYSAGADARALADTLLSEDSLRELTAELMNRVLEIVWPELPRAKVTVESVLATVMEATRAEEAEVAETAPVASDDDVRPRRVLTSWRAWAQWPKWKRAAWWRKNATTAPDLGARKMRPQGWIIRAGK